MKYSEHDLDELYLLKRQLSDKFLFVAEKFLGRQYAYALAREYAEHGFLRRFGTLRFCAHRVFDCLPPEESDFPTQEQLLTATVNIQAFVFNTFGCLDNLAWLWVIEKGVTQPNGKALTRTQIGLGPKNNEVRNSLSPQFLNYLKSIQIWFEHLEELRHALAHRIPLYIPPFVVKQDDLQRYRDFENKLAVADRENNEGARKSLEAERRELTQFSPIIKHSFETNSPEIPFHKQMLADFLAVEQIALRLFAELNQKSE